MPTTYLRITDRRKSCSLIREVAVVKGSKLLEVLAPKVGVRYSLHKDRRYELASEAFLRSVLGTQYALLVSEHIPPTLPVPPVNFTSAAEKRLPPEAQDD